MPTSHPRPWTLYVLTFSVALLAGASVVYWVLGTMGVANQRVQAASVDTKSDAPDAKDLARALGGPSLAPASAPSAASTQYQLLGVVAGPVGKGYALLVVGSAAPKAYTVGTALAEGLVLQSVSARGAKLGATLLGPTTLELALPKPHGW
jgi:general secretion pathway protein C